MSLLALGIFGFYSMFQIDDLRLFFTGQKELWVETGDPVYDGAKNFSTLMMGELTDLSDLNPRWSNMNQSGGDPGDISQIASYQNPEAGEEEAVGIYHYQEPLGTQDLGVSGKYKNQHYQFNPSISYRKFLWKTIFQTHPFYMSSDILPGAH